MSEAMANVVSVALVLAMGFLAVFAAVRFDQRMTAKASTRGALGALSEALSRNEELRSEVRGLQVKLDTERAMRVALMDMLESERRIHCDEFTRALDVMFAHASAVERCRKEPPKPWEELRDDAVRSCFNDDSEAKAPEEGK